MPKTYIVTGHFGSGKTEFCVNLALDMVQSGAVAVADLDVINPYFRSRERAKLFASLGIELVSDHLENNTGQDLPAVNFSFLSRAGKANLIMDLGGGLSGLRLLTACSHTIQKGGDYEFLCVLNPFRPDTDTIAKMVEFVNGINGASELKVTGLVNNGHMLHHTTADHVLESQEITMEIANILNLPLRYTLLRKDIYNEISDDLKSDKVLTFDKLQMREEWL